MILGIDFFLCGDGLSSVCGGTAGGIIAVFSVSRAIRGGSFSTSLAFLLIPDFFTTVGSGRIVPPPPSSSALVCLAPFALMARSADIGMASIGWDEDDDR